jgi:hypothetical protein
MWAAFGGQAHTRVKDIVVDSAWTRAYAVLVASIDGFKKLSWWQRIRAVDNVEWGRAWNVGLPDDWSGVAIGLGVEMRGLRPF